MSKHTWPMAWACTLEPVHTTQMQHASIVIQDNSEHLSADREHIGVLTRHAPVEKVSELPAAPACPDVPFSARLILGCPATLVVVSDLLGGRLASTHRQKCSAPGVPGLLVLVRHRQYLYRTQQLSSQYCSVLSKEIV